MHGRTPPRENLQKGVLFRYNQSLGIYRCPADRSTVLDQGLTPRNRSVSMSMYMNFRPPARGPGLPAVLASPLTNQAPRPQFRRGVHRGEREPHPAKRFGLNAPEALTLFNSSLWTWISFPEPRHNNAGPLSFADVPVEKWRWREANTLHVAQLNDGKVIKPTVPNTDRDLGRCFKAIPEKAPVLYTPNLSRRKPQRGNQG